MTTSMQGTHQMQQYFKEGLCRKRAKASDQKLHNKKLQEIVYGRRPGWDRNIDRQWPYSNGVWTEQVSWLQIEIIAPRIRGGGKQNPFRIEKDNPGQHKS